MAAATVTQNMENATKNEGKGSTTPSILRLQTITTDTSHEEGTRRCQICKKGPKAWCLKYFCDGQNVNEHQRKNELGIPDQDISFAERMLTEYRRPLAILIPAVIFHVFWWSFMIYNDTWHHFKDKYSMTITMVFGSMMAGMTSVGGGLFAFAVITFVLNLDPSIARDYGVMIQSCGMSAASFTIIFMRLQVEWTTVLLGVPSGAIGVILGLHFVDTELSPDQKKMIFASTWIAFSSVIFFLNGVHKRRTFGRIPNLCWWKALVILLTGLCGGIFTSFAGNGLEMSCYAMLTLLFRVSEKTATPTCIILMASASIITWIWRGLMLSQIESLSWEYLTVTIPVVVIGAPIGSFIGSYFHRQVLAMMLCLVNLASLIGAYVAIEMTWQIGVLSVAIIIGGAVTFILITVAGHFLLRYVDRMERTDTDISFNL